MCVSIWEGFSQAYNSFTNPCSYDGPGNKAAIRRCCCDTEVVVWVFVSGRQEDGHDFLVVAALRTISWQFHVIKNNKSVIMMWHYHWELHVWWTSPFISDPPKLWNLPRGVLKQYWQLEQMKAVLQVMLKASIIVPLSGAMVHCRGLPPVGGMPLLLTGNILVGRGVAGCVKASTLALVVRMPLLLPGNIPAGRCVVGLVKESTLGWVVSTVVAVGSLSVVCVDLVFMVYSVYNAAKLSG